MGVPGQLQSELRLEGERGLISGDVGAYVGDGKCGFVVSVRFESGDIPTVDAGTAPGGGFSK